MAKTLCVIVIALCLQVFACNASKEPLASDENAIKVQSLALRIRTELKNAELESEIGRVTIENRIKQARNNMAMHVHEAKTNLKSSKDFLKPNGMYIGQCVSNATKGLEQLPLSALYLCSKDALVPITQRISELRMLEFDTHKIVFYCHVSGSDLNTCVQSSVDDVAGRMEDLAQGLRDDVDALRNDACVSRAESETYESMGEILNEFARCLESELVE